MNTIIRLLRSSHAVNCQTDLLIHKIEKGSRNTSHCCGCEGSPKGGENVLKITLYFYFTIIFQGFGKTPTGFRNHHGYQLL